MNEVEASGHWKAVSSGELGTNCWLPRRFLKGERCERVMRCTYPEKATCQAVEVEVEFLSRRIIEVFNDSLVQVQRLAKTINALQKGQKKPCDENRLSID